ncbi:hypothetical protein KPH14_012711, partial [Odynerus spinipes]
TTHLKTTPYHPAANGMVERLHRQLKAAIRCHETADWASVLPVVLLGMRNAWKEDLSATTAEMVYGSTLRLPGEFFGSLAIENETEFVAKLRKYMRALQPVPASRHGTKSTFVFKELQNATHVYVRRDMRKASLQQPYDGPFKVLERHKRHFVVRMANRDVQVSIDRLKPVYEQQDTSYHRAEFPYEECESDEPVIQNDVAQNIVNRQPLNDDARWVTKRGRRVKFPDRFQAGFA